MVLGGAIAVSIISVSSVNVDCDRGTVVVVNGVVSSDDYGHDCVTRVGG